MTPLEEEFPPFEDMPAEPVDLTWPPLDRDLSMCADWQFLHFGAVNLFWRKEHYEAARATLTECGYEIISLDGQDADAFRIDLSNALRWFDLFGYEPWTGNLDALNDAFWRLQFGPSNCLALCVANYDRLAEADPRLAHALLDIVEGVARNYLLDGCRLAALIQTNDPDFQAQNLGARSATWNRNEQFRSLRGPEST